ncbi:MAG: potassium channel protein [Gemmatimonadetes bacterium]|nr:potassium channel protein [Gemmatimonadota bacterium]
MSLIAANVLAVIMETLPSLRGWSLWFRAFDEISLTIFTLEYLTRLWVCTSDPRYGGSLRGRLEFMRTPMAIVDLLAILPFFLPVLLPIDLRELRAIRLVRFFRVFKLARYSRSLRLLARVFQSKREELMIALFIEAFLLIFVSSVMYHVEHDAQPEIFTSIPASMWWGVVTLTTVGYGDMSPVTIAGKICAAVLAVSGVAMFALPAGILASGFRADLGESPDEGSESTRCPHCGKESSEFVGLTLDTNSDRDLKSSHESRSEDLERV